MYSNLKVIRLKHLLFVLHSHKYLKNTFIDNSFSGQTKNHNDNEVL